MPKISCILPTKNRPLFLKQAIRYFQSQTWKDAELIVVDDSDESCEAIVPCCRGIRYIRVRESVSLGTKLNLGIESAGGDYVHKMDDDDFYSPIFLYTMLERSAEVDMSRRILAISKFTVYVAETQRLVNAGDGWFAGGTYFFHRAAWRKAPFRDAPRRVDVYFLEDHPELERLQISAGLVYMLVRHMGQHTWTKMVREAVIPGKHDQYTDVTDFFNSLPRFMDTLESVVGRRNARFYRGLSQGPAKV